MDTKFDLDEVLQQAGKVPKAARLGIVAAIVAGVVGGYYMMFYRADDVEIARLAAEADELQRKLNKVRSVANNLSDFEQEVANLERELELALKQLPDRKQFEDLLQDITTAGKRVGVTIKGISRKPEQPHDFYAEVPFDLELEGSYHDLAQFFERVARLPRIVNIGSLTMKVQGGSSPGDETVLKVQGTATTFRFLSKETAGAPLFNAGGLS